METPAGLIVALSPDMADELMDETQLERAAGIVPVFALAVPCPTCGGDGVRRLPSPGPPYDAPVRMVDGSPCGDCRSGWVHHGDYRVLEVLPNLEWATGACDPQTAHLCIHPAGDMAIWRANGEYAYIPEGVPGAVPGGVALIVERVDG